MHDALDMSAMFWDEIAQLRETGHDVDAAVAEAADTDFGDRAAAARLVEAGRGTIAVSAGETNRMSCQHAPGPFLAPAR